MHMTYYIICDAHVLTHSKKHLKSVTAIFFFQGGEGVGGVKCLCLYLYKLMSMHFEIHLYFVLSLVV